VQTGCARVPGGAGALLTGAGAFDRVQGPRSGIGRSVHADRRPGLQEPVSSTTRERPDRNGSARSATPRWTFLLVGASHISRRLDRSSESRPPGQQPVARSSAPRRYSSTRRAFIPNENLNPLSQVRARSRRTAPSRTRSRIPTSPLDARPTTVLLLRREPSNSFVFSRSTARRTFHEAAKRLPGERTAKPGKRDAFSPVPVARRSRSRASSAIDPRKLRGPVAFDNDYCDPLSRLHARAARAPSSPRLGEGISASSRC